jgi:tetratricopeptide (TPR) repeat protein
MEMLGAALKEQQRYLEAEPLLRDKLAALQRTVGPDHQDNVSTRLNLAECLEGQGKNAEAEAVLREALEVSLRSFGPRHADTSIRVMHSLAKCHVSSGDSAPAKEVWNQAFALITDERVRSARLNAAAWWLLGPPPGEPRYPGLSLEFALQANGLTGNANPAYLDTLALAYHQTGDTAKAIDLQRKALALIAADAPDRAQYLERLVEFERAVGPQRDDTDR